MITKLYYGYTGRSLVLVHELTAETRALNYRQLVWELLVGLPEEYKVLKNELLRCDDSSYHFKFHVRSVDNIRIVQVTIRHLTYYSISTIIATLKDAVTRYAAENMLPVPQRYSSIDVAVRGVRLQAEASRRNIGDDCLTDAITQLEITDGSNLNPDQLLQWLTVLREGREFAKTYQESGNAEPLLHWAELLPGLAK